MADDAPTPPPAITPEEEAAAKAARIAKGRANLLPPPKPGERRNPTGANGRTKNAVVVAFLDAPCATGEEKTRFQRLLESGYLRALKGDGVVWKTFVEQYAGKAKQQIDLSNDDGSILPAVIRICPAKSTDEGGGVPSEPPKPDGT